MGRVVAAVIGILLAFTLASAALAWLRGFVVFIVIAVVVMAVIRLLSGRSRTRR
jgi:hypothetical protein